MAVDALVLCSQRLLKLWMIKFFGPNHCWWPWIIKYLIYSLYWWPWMFKISAFNYDWWLWIMKFFTHPLLKAVDDQILGCSHFSIDSLYWSLWFSSSMLTTIVNVRWCSNSLFTAFIDGSEWLNNHSWSPLMINFIVHSLSNPSGCPCSFLTTIIGGHGC